MIPTWQAESDSSILSSCSTTASAPASPSSASCSILPRRLRTSANSAATKKPLMAINSSRRTSRRTLIGYAARYFGLGRPRPFGERNIAARPRGFFDRCDIEQIMRVATLSEMLEEVVRLGEATGMEGRVFAVDGVTTFTNPRPAPGGRGRACTGPCSPGADDRPAREHRLLGADGAESDPAQRGPQRPQKLSRGRTTATKAITVSSAARWRSPNRPLSPATIAVPRRGLLRSDRRCGRRCHALAPKVKTGDRRSEPELTGERRRRWRPHRRSDRQELLCGDGDRRRPRGCRLWAAPSRYPAAELHRDGFGRRGLAPRPPRRNP